MENINTETEPKGKRKLSTGRKIIIAILMLLVLLIVGAGLFTLIKLYSMSVGATNIVARPTVAPFAADTPEPGVTITSDTPDDLTRDVDDPLDPSLVSPEDIYRVENPIDPNVINILVMGEDKRGGEAAGRSDVMLIVSYDMRVNSVKVVSVLRDTWIYIPGRSLWNRVNAAYRFGGIGLAINTINDNFGLDIQYYMLTDFEKLTKIVDTMGGLDLRLSEDEIAYYNAALPEGRKLVPNAEGYCHMDGEQVLMHCRNRTLGNGDWSRTDRQRSVMEAFFRRASQEKDAAALTSLMYKLMGYVETNMSPWQMISMGTRVVFAGHGAVARGTIPCSGSWSYAYERDMAVIHIDLEKNKQWLHQFLYGAN